MTAKYSNSSEKALTHDRVAIALSSVMQCVPAGHKVSIDSITTLVLKDEYLTHILPELPSRETIHKALIEVARNRGYGVDYHDGKCSVVGGQLPPVETGACKRLRGTKQ